MELKDELLRHPELFMRSFSEHLLSYALDQAVAGSKRDEPEVDAILSRVMKDRGQFTTVVRELFRVILFARITGKTASRSAFRSTRREQKGNP